MKFLTFVDLNRDKKKLAELMKRAAEDDIEFILCAGNLSRYSNEIKLLFEKGKKLGKKVYFIPASDREWKAAESVLEEFPESFNLSGRAIIIGDYVFCGYGGNGLKRFDSEFRKVAREWYSNHKDKKIVLVLHGPPYETKMDKIENGYVGNIDYKKFIERINPKLVICGYVIENAGKMDKIGSTKIINPGFDGMVIELK